MSPMLLSQVARELESMRCRRVNAPHDEGSEFPTAARHLLYSLPGNHACMDCGAAHPSWASISFGTLLCLQCSGHHRGLGVQTSRVQSVELDTWSQAQVLALLEGGNLQLQQFFDRHLMGNSTPLASNRQRYHTKAAQFYRKHLAQHVGQVAEGGIYQGREAARQKHANSNSSSSSSSSSSTSSCSTTSSEVNANLCTSSSESTRTRSIAVAQ
jgi:Putative GTPase activating protein for Arf